MPSTPTLRKGGTLFFHAPFTTGITGSLIFQWMFVLFILSLLDAVLLDSIVYSIGVGNVYITCLSCGWSSTLKSDVWIIMAYLM